MRIISRITAADTMNPARIGCPKEVELTDVELVIQEIHDNLMDVGMSQGQALRLIMGGDVPAQLRNSPLMDAQDPEFLMRLAD